MELVHKLACVLLGCWLALAQAQEPTCTQTLDSVSPRIQRLTCHGPNFNFSKLHYDTATETLFAGGTNLLMSLDKQANINEQVSLADSDRRDRCLAACDRCVQTATPGSETASFCSAPSGVTVCLPWLRPVCENWVSLIQPVADSNGKNYLVTCGTVSTFTNVSNCQIRSMSNISVVYESFQATLGQSSSVPRTFLSIGTGTVPGVSTAGRLAAQYYTAGHKSGNGRFISLRGRSFFDSFDYVHSDTFQRQNSALMSPPLPDFSFTWTVSLFKASTNPNSDTNRGHFTRYVLQYVYQGFVYVWASSVGPSDNGQLDHGAVVFRYCQNDAQNATYLSSLRRIRVACSGLSSLRNFNARGIGSPASRWEMRQITSAIEVSDPGLATRQYVVASFTTLEGLPLGSSICAYSKQSVSAAFNDNPGRNYAETQRCAADYSQAYPSGCSTPLSDAFVMDYSNTDFTIQPDSLFTATASKAVNPLWTRQGVALNHLAFGSYREAHYIFTATDDGRVFRLASLDAIFYSGNAGLTFSLINELRVGQNDGDPEVMVNDIAFMPSSLPGSAPPPNVAITTRRSVTIIPATDCEQYSGNCSTCIALEGGTGFTVTIDPNCVWCPDTRSCGVRDFTCPSQQYPTRFRASGQRCVGQPEPMTFSGSIIKSPVNTTGIFNTTISFSCQANANAPITFSWMRLVGLEMVAVPASRSTVTSVALGDELTETSTLTLSGVTAADGGQYVCLARNTGSLPVQSEPATLFIRPYIESGPSNTLVFLSQALTMRCGGDGYPTPSFQWFHAGTNIAMYASLYPNIHFVGASGRDIIIQPTTLQVAGLYVCRVVSIHGMAQTEAAQLTVIDAVPANSSVHTPLVGSALVLSCPDNNGPFEWRVNGTLIAGATTSELTLSNIQPASSGRYLCQQAFQFFVFVSSPARIARAPSNASVTQGTPVELRCNTQANIYPPVTINWLYQAINSLGEPTGERTSLSLAVLSDNLIYAGGQVLRFSSIQISDSGLFTCYASNTLGNVTATAMVTVNVPLGTPNCPVSAQFQTGVAASPIVSTCSVTGPSGTVVQIRQGSSLLQSGGRIDIGTERNVTADLHTATLSIAEPVAGDHALYACEASFNGASTRCEFFLSTTDTGGNVGSSTSSNTSDGTLIGTAVACAVGGLFIGAILVYLTVKRAEARRANAVTGYPNGAANIQERSETPVPPNTKFNGMATDYPDGKVLPAGVPGVVARPPNLDRGASRTTEVSHLSLTPSGGHGSNLSLRTTTPMTPIASVPSMSPGVMNANLNNGTPEFQRQNSQV
ncbi:uncharacterized protein LOC135819921 isoform X2 [Sycon ciliatum]|uniref:uncharacterized protein LOC135819921 isoform X2 n=1 Tax=Sycon ciliatum TaxID=27933 RepID=UPI0031F60A66